MSMGAVGELLREQIGLDVETIGRGAVERALRRTLGEEDGEGAAVRRLREEPALLRRLIEAVVVPETWFFRDGKPFEVLAAEAARRRGRGRKVRVLSLPCSTGEEAWSIAITLREAGLAADEFSVEARELSAPALTAAKRGVYGRNSFRSATDGWRERWLEPVDGEWRVRDELRESVDFAPANLFTLSAAEPAHDFVFCRNLLIYFDAATQREALRRLRAQLAPDGLLFVGHAEAAVALREGFAPRLERGGFCFGLEAPVRRPVLSPAPGRPVRFEQAPPASAPRAPEARSAAPAERDADWLGRARRSADLGDLTEAARLAREHIGRAGPAAEAYCLLGLVHDAEGRKSEAEADYRRALYLEPRHVSALAHLALLLEERGEVAAARRLRARADKGGVA